MWHLRRLMAEHGMFATTGLVPLLAARGVCLSREQVCRLVTGTPERLSLNTLAALCGILGCGPGDLVEPVASGGTDRQAWSRSGCAAGGPDPAAAGPDPARPGQGGVRVSAPGTCPAGHQASPGGAAAAAAGTLRGSGGWSRPVARRWPDRRGR